MKTKPREMKMLGDYLRRIRLDLGLSMHEVSRRTNLTPSYISKIENGSSFQTVSAHGLVEFAKAYSLPPQIILERSGFIDEREDELPGLVSYLRIKYKVPHQAAAEMEIAWDIIKKKYKIGENSEI